jgi:ribosomal protein L32
VLGLSLSKILITILIIVAIWKGFTLVSRLASERQAGLKRQASAARRAAKGAHAAPAGTVELRECPRCGAYVDPREGCRCGMRRNEARRANS